MEGKGAMNGVGKYSVPVLVLLVGVLSLNFWLLFRPRTVVGPGQGGIAKLQIEQLQNEVSSLQNRIAANEQANTDLQGDLKVVTDKLNFTQGQLKKARAETAKAVEDTTDKLTALDTNVHTELATKAANDDLKNVDTKVVGVRTDLDSTQNDLKMARSEMGTLIARNHDEIDQLRRLGERDYIEFTISAKNQPQNVGNVTVELKGVNEKKNRVNIVYIFQDKRYEAKNVNINTPIFFYSSGSYLQEELVVTKIAQNGISGYVSIPRNQSPRSF
jgi:hypothetical protein